MLGITAILAWVIKAIYKVVKVVLYCLAYILLYFWFMDTCNLHAYLWHINAYWRIKFKHSKH